jgi:hypothetical protein
VISGVLRGATMRFVYAPGLIAPGEASNFSDMQSLT